MDSSNGNGSDQPVGIMRIIYDDVTPEDAIAEIERLTDDSDA